MKRIGILTSGGDAPGMNACIRAVVRAALANNLECVGIRDGYEGLMRGDVVPLDRNSIRNIIHLGGTILGTSRTEEFKEREGQSRAVATIKDKGLAGLVLLGGDGTFQGGNLLAKQGVSVVGVPCTIDNDCYGTDYSIGFDTAVNTAVEAIDRIRDTADSIRRLFFIEVMGRHSGFIAVDSGIAGGAEEIVIPETPVCSEELCGHIKAFLERGKRSIIVVVAEADKPGRTFQLADEVKCNIGLESRVCVLGHVQRGGTPTARDRVLAGKLGAAAVQALIDGDAGKMAGEIKGDIVLTPLDETYQKKQLPVNLMDLLNILTD